MQIVEQVMVLRFIGAERAVEWAEKNFKKAVENINKTLTNV